jgi:hypothetical protein
MSIVNSIRYAMAPAIHALGIAGSLALTFIVLHFLDEDKVEMLLGFGITMYMAHYTDNAIQNLIHYQKNKHINPSLTKVGPIRILAFPIVVIVYVLLLSVLNLITNMGWSVHVGIYVGVLIPFVLHTFMLGKFPWRYTGE